MSGSMSERTGSVVMLWLLAAAYVVVSSFTGRGDARRAMAQPGSTR